MSSAKTTSKPVSVRECGSAIRISDGRLERASNLPEPRAAIGVLKDPKASARDKAMAQRQLDAHLDAVFGPRRQHRRAEMASAHASLLAQIKALETRIATMEKASAVAAPASAAPPDGVVSMIEAAERNVLRNLPDRGRSEKASAVRGATRVSPPTIRPLQTPMQKDRVIESIERAGRNTLRSIRK